MKNFVKQLILLILVVSAAGAYFSNHRLCTFDRDKFATIWCYDKNGYDTRILLNGEGKWSMLTYRNKKSANYQGHYTIRGGQLFAMTGDKSDKIVFKATLSSCEQLHIHSVDSRFFYLDDGNFLSPCRGK